MRIRLGILAIVAAVAVMVGGAPAASAAGTCSAKFTNGNATPTFATATDTWHLPQVDVFNCASSTTQDDIYVSLQYSSNGTTWHGPFQGYAVTNSTTGDMTFSVSFGPGAVCTPGLFYRAHELNEGTGNSDYSAVVYYTAC